MLPKINEIKWNELFEKYRFPVGLLLVGLILIGLGIFVAKNNKNVSSSKIEILESASEGQSSSSEVIVEVAGAVENPGVYKLTNESRIEDLLIAAGGVSADADREWMEKVLNRAAKLIDGQKIYIPTVDEQSDVLSAKNSGGDQSTSSTQGSDFSKTINVNTASQEELESLWGIGPVTAQSIIEHRPYSTVEELLSRKILKSNVYERNKDLLTVY